MLRLLRKYISEKIEHKVRGRLTEKLLHELTGNSKDKNHPRDSFLRKDRARDVHRYVFDEEHCGMRQDGYRVRC